MIGLTPEEYRVSEEARRRLTAFVIRHGVEMRRSSVPFDGEPGECWTNAWRGEGAYVEGVVYAENGAFGGTHAWNLDALGMVVERTPRYGKVDRYVGVVIPRDGWLAAPTRAWTGLRESILERALLHLPDAEVMKMLGQPVPKTAPVLPGMNRRQRRAAERKTR
jgi:hypothetical protein